MPNPSKPSQHPSWLFHQSKLAGQTCRRFFSRTVTGRCKIFGSRMKVFFISFWWGRLFTVDHVTNTCMHHIISNRYDVNYTFNVIGLHVSRAHDQERPHFCNRIVVFWVVLRFTRKYCMPQSRPCRKAATKTQFSKWLQHSIVSWSLCKDFGLSQILVSNCLAIAWEPSSLRNGYKS